ncbi:hypothetical protein BAE44_0025147 [Dichanthelium oligosanthes]|uniref:ATP synthase subunit O, mitochondrial n=1 Tax=Dichanthelium oligosanthes TaxID=888268 RepID=A0A1E5ULS9_9POAL|nr:hypothetical protein BAE44_0025147 [Dichanthelium oligosanthes]
MAAARHLRSGLPLLRAHLAASESAAVAQGSRGFASQVAKPTGKQVKVPEALYGGTGNYASALFLTAAKTNTLDKPLPEKEEKELKETLQDILGKNKTILVEQKIDYSIMGGLVIEFGQKVFDMSIKTRAKQMEAYLRQPLEI